MTMTPALEAPLTATPHTLIGVYPVGHIYYFEFDSEPGPEEYVAAGVAISKIMLFQIGQRPAAWIYRPTAEIRWGEISNTTREPIRVV